MPIEARMVLDTDGADWFAETPDRFAAFRHAVDQGRLHGIPTSSPGRSPG